ncbi:hypothetical protein JOM56_001723, partial [Amanita muscaria]
TGNICDKNRVDLPPETLPTPRMEQEPDDWSPYSSRIQFETADFLYCRNQMSGSDIDFLLNLWKASLVPHGDDSPFSNHKDLYRTIDATTLGDVSWQSFSLYYTGERPDDPVPSWMEAEYDVWYRDPRKLIHELISNPDFKGEFDYAPFHDYVDGKHRFRDFMSGDWAWKQADKIGQDPTVHGSMFVPIILGSDKTTVSVATGNNEYWPIYLSIGNIHNNTRRAHRNGVVLLGFHAIPKADKEHARCPKFRKFRRQLFHTTLSTILSSLLPAMNHPELVRCPDDHFRRVIYGIRPYVADYPEQCLLACVVQGWCSKCLAPTSDLDGKCYAPRCIRHTTTLLEELKLGQLWDSYGLVGDIVPFTEDFPLADIHELIAPDILHQLVKGTFKDHAVTWIQSYQLNLAKALG